MRLSKAYQRAAGAALLAGASVLAMPGRAGDGDLNIASVFNNLQHRGDPKFLEYGSATRPLKGHVEFCARLPAECSAFFPDTKMVVLTDERYKQLQDINREINRSIQPVTDKDQHGVEERWSFPDSGNGDCEDYVLAKRKALHERMGIPLNAMSIVKVIDEERAGHAILAVRTNRGDLLLDNKNDELRLPFQTGYEFRQATSFEHVQSWQSISAGRPRIDAASDPIGALIEQSARTKTHPPPPRRPRSLTPAHRP